MQSEIIHASYTGKLIETINNVIYECSFRNKKTINKKIDLDGTFDYGKKKYSVDW